MTATLTPPEQATKTIILDNISWETYQRLLADRGERAKPRYAYDRGRLEIMVSSFEHENLKHDIATLVEVIAEELQLDLVGAASTTFDREGLTQGFEPDACFYLQNAARVRGRKRIDLAIDPPPELVIEIDVTSPSLDKFPIFAGLGIEEVWRYHKQVLTVFRLQGAIYEKLQASEVLPGIAADTLTRLIANSQQMKRTEWLREVRESTRPLRNGR
jgi:Uma2 family endonuclease